MARIPPKNLSDAARRVALASRIPWRAKDLKAAALEAYRTVEPPPASLGLPPAQVSEAMLRKICEHVEKAAGLMDRLPPDKQEPTDEQIREALGTFSEQDWLTLIDEFDQNDTDALLSYLEANKSPLQNWLGAEKFFYVHSRAIQRHLASSWDQPGMGFVVITDPLEAAGIHKGARRLSIDRVQRPPGQERSWDEMSRPNHISEELSASGRKVSPYKVREILKRMKRKPPQDFDGSVQHYLVWAADPKIYERELSARSGGVPRRKSDPFFASED